MIAAFQASICICFDLKMHQPSAFCPLNAIYSTYPLTPMIIAQYFPEKVVHLSWMLLSVRSNLLTKTCELFKWSHCLVQSIKLSKNIENILTEWTIFPLNMSPNLHNSEYIKMCISDGTLSMLAENMTSNYSVMIHLHTFGSRVSTQMHEKICWL